MTIASKDIEIRKALHLKMLKKLHACPDTLIVDELGLAHAQAPRKGPLDFRHPHLGFDRVGNKTILMGGMMHLIELFRTGLSVAAPRNLWA
jgi:hypothetical protein